MKVSIPFLYLLGASGLSHATPTFNQERQAPNPYPYSGGEPPSVASQRAAAVKSAFQFAWNGYYKYAFPNDELLPVNNSFSNTRNGWGASAADAFSTALVMQDATIVNQILNFVPKINWSRSYMDESVSLFETTIRYLGGILSAYDLLSGPLNNLAKDKTKIPVLLQQAQNLANNLSFAFDTKTGIPYNNIFVPSRKNDGSTTNGLATIGTLVLEWTRLSDLTGNKKYGALAQKGETYLLNPQPPNIAEPFPGLLGSTIDINTGKFVDSYGGWTGGNDSFYEYLIKMYVYDQSRFGQYKDRWVLAADSSMKYLASHPAARPDLTFMSVFAGKKTLNHSDHLACFSGGNFILAGSVLNQQKYIDYGLALVEGCEDLYSQTLTGIGPDQYSWNTSTIPANQTAYYKRAGYYITDGHYYLRPEVIESFYYAFRVTGQRKYQDYAWNAFVAINATARVGSGFSELTNVNAKNGGSFTNFQDSFLFAEVMKYSYLIHAPDAVYQVNYKGKNPWVFNTEGHLLKVAGTPI